MPSILVKDYSWRQTDDVVIINVPLCGNPKSIDFLAVDNYIKASNPPFILELFLWGSIAGEKSSCTVNKNQAELVFVLKKVDFGLLWPKLILEDLDKESKKERRARALEESQVILENEAKARSEKTLKLKKQAVRAQINLDTAGINDINKKRDFERAEAMKEFDEWRLRTADPFLPDIDGEKQENRMAPRPPLQWFNDMPDSSDCQEKTLVDSNREELGCPEGARSNRGASCSKQEETNESKFDKTTNNPGLGTESDEFERSNPEISKPDIEDLLITTDSQSSHDREASASNKFSNDDPKDSSSSCDDSELETEPAEQVSGSTTHRYINEINKIRYKQWRKQKCQRERQPSKLLERMPSISNGIFEGQGKSVPLPRKNSRIDVKFSKRSFPTPARESNITAEQQIQPTEPE